MANTKLYTAVAIVIIRVPKTVQGLILVILVAVLLYQITSPQDLLDTDQDLPLGTSKSHRSSRPAPKTPALTRPSLKRRNCFVIGPNRLTSQPLSSDWKSDSPFDSDSEGYETAPEDAAPTMTMAEKRALKYFEQRLRQHQESVSSETSASPGTQTELTTNVQIRNLSNASDDNFCNEEDDTEMLRRRNIKMREEGVRVSINYSQLAYLKPAPAPRSEPASYHATGAVSLPLAASPPPSSPSSGPSTTPPLSGLLSPAPTPCGGITSTGITTPEGSPASLLPTSGRAAEVLDRIDEKLLAIPADAVSRRLLRDGRASLYRSKTLSRDVSFAGASSSSSQQTPSPVEGGLQGSNSRSWYPSDLVE